MCRDTWVTGCRVDIARTLRPVWRNDATSRRLMRHRQSCPMTEFLFCKMPAMVDACGPDCP
jgi:hypothetical protein